MFGRAVRPVLAICLATILVLPLANATLSSLGFADGRVMVICTGDGLRTVVLDTAGKPVQVSSKAEPCALVNAVDTSRSMTLTELNQSSFGVLQSRIRAMLWPVSPAVGFSHPRAPPAA